MSSSYQIICQEGANDAVSVSAEQIEKLVAKSDYFRAMFEHGTVEVKTQTIHKSEWTRTVAEHIVQLVCTSTTTVKSMKDSKELLMAANEILLDTEVFGQNGDDFLQSVDEQLWTAPCLWNFETQLGEKNSETIKNEELMLIPHEGIKIILKKDESKLEQISRLDLSSLFSDIESMWSSVVYGVHCHTSDVASSILKVCKMYKKERSDKKVFHNEEISIRFPGFIPRDVMDAVAIACNINGYIHSKSSLGYYLDGGGDFCPTFIGTFDGIRKALLIIFSENNAVILADKFSLRVTSPSQGTLQKFIDATQSCQSNPGTLGVDIDANAYFAVKNKEDMLLMLKELSNSSTTKDKKGVVKLVDLTYPRGVF